tara:strand:+ start:1606 stop:2544 length:939 start_codon:yes stop_codon:yes gene_type:complete
MGEETFYIDHITNLLQDQILSEEEKSFNQTILYGKDTSITELVSLCKRYPINSEYQTVFLKEAQDLSRQIEVLSEYALNPMMSTVLIINYKYKRLDKRKKLFKNIQKFGIILDCKKMYENKIPMWITDVLKKDNYTIDYKSSFILTEYLGNDLNKINNQLNKLKILCSKEKIIDSKLIEKNIGISKEYNVFELRNAIGQKNFKKSIEISNYLSSNTSKHPVQLILSSIFNYFIQIFQLHCINNKSESNISKVLGINPYFVNEYVNASKKYSMKNISIIISLINECDLKSKGVGVPKISNNDLLRQLITQIIN